jgi:hypothetical protein
MSDAGGTVPISTTPSDWRAASVAAGIDPEVIEHAGRCYLLHREHAHKTGRRATPLVEWFRWFALENAAELSSEKIVVKGCSVDESSVRPPTATAKQQIFVLVAQYVASEPAASA